MTSAHSRLRSFSRQPCFLAILLAGSLAQPLARAADKTWTGSTDNAWNVDTNWIGGAPTAADMAVFNAGVAFNLHTVLGASRIIGGLVFNTNAISPITISGLSQSGAVLTFEGGAAIDISVAVGSPAISGSGAATGGPELAVQGAQVWHIAGNASLDIGARIGGDSENQTITKTGAGMLVLSGSNGGWNFGGVGGLFTVSAGTLSFTQSLSFGNVNNKYAVLAGATLELGGATAYQSAGGNLTLNGSGVDGLGALHVVTFGASIFDDQPSASLILNTPSTIGVAEGGDFTINQDITGTALTKRGAGTLTLGNAANSYSGGTTVLEGTLRVASATALGAGPLTISGGSVDLSGPIVLAAGSNFSMGSGTLLLDLGETFDQISGSDGAVFSITGGTLALTNAAVGEYPIFSGFAGGSVSGLSFTGLGEGFSASLADSGVLTVVPEPAVCLYGLAAAVLMGIVFRRGRR